MQCPPCCASHHAYPVFLSTECLAGVRVDVWWIHHLEQCTGLKRMAQKKRGRSCQGSEQGKTDGGWVEEQDGYEGVTIEAPRGRTTRMAGE